MVPDAIGALSGGRRRHDLVAEVGRALAPVQHDAAVVVGVSGGPDSSALAALVDEARPDLDLLLVHIRHGLRDDADDLAAVTRLAAMLGSRLRIHPVEVRVEGRGLEDAARRARHLALRRLASAAGAVRVLLGHTADDQAETVLLRLARGTGVDGLGAMRPDTGRVLRPMLRLRRADVHAFTRGEGLPEIHDPMNDDPRVRRVRVRQHVLPALQGVGGDPVGALARLADLAAGDNELLEQYTDDVVREHVVTVGACQCVSSAALETLGEPTARRIVRRMLRSADEEQEAGPPADHVAAALTLRPGAALDVGTTRVSCGGGWLAVGPATPPDAIQVPLHVPGRLSWPLLGADLLASEDVPTPSLPLDIGPGPLVPPEPVPQVPGLQVHWLSIRLPGDVGPLAVRTARAGDRVATHGGTRKLSDILVDAGVPRVVRPLLPLLVRDNAVVWVPGLAADRRVLDAGRSSPGPVVHLVRHRRQRPTAAAVA